MVLPYHVLLDLAGEADRWLPKKTMREDQGFCGERRKVFLSYENH